MNEPITDQAMREWTARAWEKAQTEENTNRDAIIRMARDAGFTTSNGFSQLIVRHSNGSWVDIAENLDRFAALVAASERNKLAAWMIQYGYATGHGDTMEQLCNALGTEIVESIEAEILAEKHRILRIVYEESTAYGKTGECMWIGVKHKVGKK